MTRIGRIAFFAAFALVVGGVAWLQFDVQRSLADDASASTTALGTMVEQVVQTENSARDFIGSRDPSALASVKASREQLDATVADARAAIDDHDLRDRLAHEADLIDDWVAAMSRDVDAAARGVPGDDAVSAAQRGALVSRVRVANDALLRAIDGQDHGARDRAGFAGILAIIVCCLVFAALNWVLFVRSERRAARARDEQVAFAEQLQRARSYDDAGAMLARHLEHLSPGAVAVVTGPEDRSLAGRPISSGGERVGMAILRSQHDLDAPTERLVHDSILRAAPVLRTLRTLEIAQARAATDPLTGLGNRRLVEDAIARMVAQARRTGDGYAVAVVDLDHFKAVNDTFGHHAGDALLIAIADVLTTATREYDVVGRQGGDEFIVLLSGVREDQALAVMERCRDAIASLRIGDPPIGTTASFGVAAASPGAHHDVESLVRAADAAVYVAKARGGNCIVPGSDDVVDQASAFLA